MNDSEERDRRIFSWVPLNLADLIELGVFLGILLTAVYTCISVHQQGAFNRNTLRPWVYDIPDSKIRITGNYIFCDYTLKCIGKAPADRVYSFGMVDDRASYSDKEIRDAIQKWDEVVKLPHLIHPDESLHGTDSNTMNIDIGVGDTLANLVVDKTMYRHSYIQYEDFAGNKYGLLRTWRFICDAKSDRIYRGRWLLVHSAPIRIGK